MLKKYLLLFFASLLLLILCSAGRSFADTGNIAQEWLKTYDANGYWDSPRGVTTDTDGNVYVTGFSVTSSTEVTCLTIKYDVSGNMVWQRRYLGSINPNGNYYRFASGLIDSSLQRLGISVDRSGNIYVAGSLLTYDQNYVRPYFLIKYDASGNLVMEKNDIPSIRGNDVPPPSVAVDYEGNVYLAGTNGYIQWSSTVGDFVAYTNYFLRKYDPAGNLVRHLVYDSEGANTASGVAVDESGNAYVTGIPASYNPIFGAFDTTRFDTVKFDRDGNVAWVASTPGDKASSSLPSIARDGQGNVAVGGVAKWWSSFSLTKYSQQGDTVWARYYPKNYFAEGPYSTYEQNFAVGVFAGMAVDCNGNYYMAGMKADDWSHLTMAFDPEGNLLWSKSEPSYPGRKLPYGIAADCRNNVYVTGLIDRANYYTLKYRVAFQITTATLPVAFAGESYNQRFLAAGGNYPYAWSISQGSLPAGLTMDAATGGVYGTPTIPGTYDFAVTVADRDGAQATRQFSLTVKEPFAITTTSLPPGKLNEPYSQALIATGGQAPYVWTISAGALPAGLYLGASTGVISGTPTSIETAAFTVQIKDANDRISSASLSINVYSPVVTPPVVLPFGTTGVPYSQTLTATGGLSPYTWTISSGELPTGLSLNSATGEIAGIPTGSGHSDFTTLVTDSNGSSASAQLSMDIYQPLVIPPVLLSFGTTGAYYNQIVTATGGREPYSWSISSGVLPAGLTLDAATGVISGTPIAPEAASFTVQVTDANDTVASAPLSVNIYDPLVIAPATFPAGDTGVPYSQILSATGGLAPYVWSIASGALPAGLSLDTGAGVISGTPLTAGSFTFAVQVTDSNGTTVLFDQPFTLVINSKLFITTVSLSTGSTGVSYSQTLAAQEGAQPYNWSVVSGALPSGLHLNSTAGEIFGIPNQLGSFSFTMQVTDGGGNTATKSFTIEINNLPPDLVVSSVSASVSSGTPEMLTITATIKNQGGGGADRSLVNFYLSSDPVITVDDIQLRGGVTVDALPAGGEVTINLTQVLQHAITPGIYYPGVIADQLNMLVESDETNNWLAGSSVTIN